MRLRDVKKGVRIFSPNNTEFAIYTIMSSWMKNKHGERYCYLKDDRFLCINKHSLYESMLECFEIATDENILRYKLEM